MEKSIKNAFTFMFKDKNWFLKWGILFVFYLPSTYCNYLFYIHKNQHLSLIQNLLFLIIIPLFIVFYSGYLSKCTNVVINSQDIDGIGLPSWNENFFGYFIIGVKRTLGILLFSLVFMIFAMIISFFTGAAVISVPLFCMFILFGIISCFVFTALDNIFCTNFRITAYFEWSKAFNIIKSNFGMYFSVLVLGLCLALLSIAFYFIKLPVLACSIISSIYVSYIAIVYAYMTGIISKDYHEPNIG